MGICNSNFTTLFQWCRNIHSKSGRSIYIFIAIIFSNMFYCFHEEVSQFSVRNAENMLVIDGSSALISIKTFASSLIFREVTAMKCFSRCVFRYLDPKAQINGSFCAPRDILSALMWGNTSSFNLWSTLELMTIFAWPAAWALRITLLGLHFFLWRYKILDESFYFLLLWNAPYHTHLPKSFPFF